VRVLITNLWLSECTGTELYVRDIALELLRQGHIPAVCSPWLGKTSEQLSAAGIQVVDSIKRLDFKPDIIHGHHRFETLSAVLRFPDVPAMYLCHDHTHWADSAPKHPRVLRYYGVSAVCVERIRASGIPHDKVAQLCNFVDLQTFQPRSPLPEKPRRVLVFSNYASEDNYLPAVAEACRTAGLELSVVGNLSGNPVQRPAEILGQYDIVFGKARAAMEAMATGCAVVLCDTSGLGPMVTSSNFDQLRPLNFGYASLNDAITRENVLGRIEQYDASDAQAVRDKLRSCAGLDSAVRDLVDIYGRVIADYRVCNTTRSRMTDLKCRPIMARRLVVYGAMRVWGTLSHRQRRSPALDVVRRGVRYVLCGRAR
jgi:hypothetical protein